MNISEVKSVLLLSHEMSMTGAPVALQYMAKQLKEDGVFVAVLSPKDGPMVEEMLQDGIPVIIDGTIGGNTEWIKWASNFNLIVVCTVVPYHNIVQLEQTDIPVVWWIHDGEMSFQLGANKVLPQDLCDNIHVYGGGRYACQVVKRYRPSYEIQELLYCVPDYAQTLSAEWRYKIKNSKNKLIISSIGSIDKRKAQDVLVKAIREMKIEDIQQCLFLFVGKNNDDIVYRKIEQLKTDFPENVQTIEQVSREEIADIYRQSAAVVCTSRDDPMPVFMTESLMLGVPVICSDHTGTYGLLKDGVNGLTFKSEDAEELKEKIKFVIENREQMQKIGQCGRKVYEDNFTKLAFRKALYEMIEKI